MEESRLWDIALDIGAAEKLIANRIAGLVQELGKDPHDSDIPVQIIRFLDLARDMDLSVELREAQTLFFQLVRDTEAGGERRLPSLFHELADRLAVSLRRG